MGRGDTRKKSLSCDERFDRTVEGLTATLGLVASVGSGGLALGARAGLAVGIPKGAGFLARAARDALGGKAEFELPGKQDLLFRSRYSGDDRMRPAADRRSRTGRTSLRLRFRDGRMDPASGQRGHSIFGECQGLRMSEI